MDVFEQSYKDLSKIDIYKLFNEFVKDENDFITGLNKKRLLEKGTDVDGNPIITKIAKTQNSGYPYAINTVFGTNEYLGKKDKGEPYNRVTTYSSGRYFKTFKALSNQDTFHIESDDKKGKGAISDWLDVNATLGVEDLEPIESKFTEVALETILIAVKI